MHSSMMRTVRSIGRLGEGGGCLLMGVSALEMCQEGCLPKRGCIQEGVQVDKMLPPMSIEPLDLYKSNTFLSELICRVLLRGSLNSCS